MPSRCAERAEGAESARHLPSGVQKDSQGARQQGGRSSTARSRRPLENDQAVARRQDQAAEPVPAGRLRDVRTPPHRRADGRGPFDPSVLPLGLPVTHRLPRRSRRGTAQDEEGRADGRTARDGVRPEQGSGRGGRHHDEPAPGPAHEHHQAIPPGTAHHGHPGRGGRAGRDLPAPGEQAGPPHPVAGPQCDGDPAVVVHGQGRARHGRPRLRHHAGAHGGTVRQGRGAPGPDRPGRRPEVTHLVLGGQALRRPGVRPPRQPATRTAP